MLTPAQATKLAALMCRQLPNVGTILSIIQIDDTQAPGAKAPAQAPYVMDDVYDTLLALGPYSVPCLVDRLTDPRFMPDPRSEPLLGAPVVGDVAYIILMDKGVADLMPELTHNRHLRMDDYFLWPSVGNHRRRLQSAVRAWLTKHPSCCSRPPAIWDHKDDAPLPQPRFQMSAPELANARGRFARLRPGMRSAQVLRIAGKPDAIDQQARDQSGRVEISSAGPNLLGICARDHNETLAYIYFSKRWTDTIATRDPLRDRYVILFFSATGKFTRMFSNVEEIPPIFVSNVELWYHLAWGAPMRKK